MKANDSNASWRGTLAVDAARLAALLGVSLRHIRRLESAGKLPQPIRLGHCLRYALDGPLGIRAWLVAGCPDRATFERRQGAATGNQSTLMEAMR